MRRYAIAIACLSATAGLPPNAVSQQPEYSVAEALAAFQRAYRSVDPVRSDPRAGLVGGVAMHPENHTREKADSLVNGLERMAIGATDVGVGLAAVEWLGVAGAHLEGVVSNLRAVYVQSSDENIRSAVAKALVGQKDAQTALELLEEMAIDPRAVEGDWPPALQAIHSLARMGEVGRATLQRLHETEAVQNPRARLELLRMSRNGFKPG